MGNNACRLLCGCSTDVLLTYDPKAPAIDLALDQHYRQIKTACKKKNEVAVLKLIHPDVIHIHWLYHGSNTRPYQANPMLVAICKADLMRAMRQIYTQIPQNDVYGQTQMLKCVCAGHHVAFALEIIRNIQSHPSLPNALRNAMQYIRHICDTDHVLEPVITAIYNQCPSFFITSYIYYMSSRDIPLQDASVLREFNATRECITHKTSSLQLSVYSWACKWDYSCIAQAIIQDICAPYISSVEDMTSTHQRQVMEMLYIACIYGRASVAYTILNMGKHVASFDLTPSTPAPHGMRESDGQFDRILRRALMHNAPDMIRLCRDLAFVRQHSYTQYLMSKLTRESLLK